MPLFGDMHSFAIALELIDQPENVTVAQGNEGSYGELMLIFDHRIITQHNSINSTNYIQCPLLPIIKWFITTGWNYTNSEEYPIAVDAINLSAAKVWSQISLTDEIEDDVIDTWWENHCLQAAGEQVLPAVFFIGKTDQVEISCIKPIVATTLVPGQEFAITLSNLITWFISQPKIRQQIWYSGLLHSAWETESLLLP